MVEIPNRANFFSILNTLLSKNQVAQLYLAIGWRVRKSTWVDYEIASDWAELTIEGESPILMDGAVADLPTRAEELVAPLREAGVAFTAECYGPEPDRGLLLEMRS